MELQKAVITEQKEKLKQQQKEIEELKNLKKQLELGYAVTNQDLYKSLLQPESTKKSIDVLSRDLLDIRKVRYFTSTQAVSYY